MAPGNSWSAASALRKGQAVIRPKAISVLARVAIGTVLTVALALVFLVLYAARSHWFPRLDVPVFDEHKAAQLSPEKRAAYEQELFSQINLWNMGSKHYPDADGIARREARWKEMAADGFELAHITLRVLQPSNGTTYSLRGPMKRLEHLAQKGDVGAMCLMVRLVTQAAIKQDWRPYQDTYMRWLDEGARLGHPECLLARGGRLLRGTDGYQRDVAEGLAQSFEAHRREYSHGTGALELHFKAKGLADLDNVKRLYCWSSIADQYWTGEKNGSRTADLLNELKRLHPSPGATEWTRLIEELSTSKYSANDCINLGTGE